MDWEVDIACEHMSILEFPQRIRLTLRVSESHNRFIPSVLGTNMSANQQTPTPLRMPLDLKEWIKAAAKANERSLNAQIVLLLTQAKEQSERTAAMS